MAMRRFVKRIPGTGLAFLAILVWGSGVLLAQTGPDPAPDGPTTSSSDGSSSEDVMIIVTDVTYDYPAVAPDISAPINSRGETAPGWRRTR